MRGLVRRFGRFLAEHEGEALPKYEGNWTVFFTVSAGMRQIHVQYVGVGIGYLTVLKNVMHLAGLGVLGEDDDFTKTVFFILYHDSTNIKLKAFN